MTKQLRIVMGLILALCASTGLFAQAGAEHKTLENIYLEGAERMTPDSFLNLITLRPGQMYTDEDVRREFFSVWESGLFDDLWVEERDGSLGGRILVFHVVERPTVTQVNYEGLKRITKADLTDKLREIDALVSPGSVLNFEKVKKTEALIRYAGMEKGYGETGVRTEITTVSKSQVEVTFYIDEGPKTRIRNVEVEGNTVFSDRKIKSMMKKTRSHWFGSFVTRKDVYTEGRFAEDVDAIRTAYEELGYIDVLVDEPEMQIQRTGGDKPRVWYDLTVHIQEGDRYTMGNLSFQGLEVLEEEKVRAAFPVKPGEALNKVALEEWLKGIEQGYGARGYIYATAGPVFTRNEDQTCDVLVNVREDQQYYINRIEFVGNFSTRDKVLRREMLVREGELFNQAAYKLGLYKVRQLGYFKMEGDPVITPLPGTDKVDITVKGSEAEKNELLFGGGYSGLNGFFLSFSFKTRNFLGMGTTLETALNIGGRQSLFDIRYFNPWFLDRRLGFGASVFLRETEYIDFTRASFGGTVSVSKPVGPFSSIRLTLSMEDSRVKEVEGLAGVLQSPYLERQNRSISTITPSYSFNSTDHPFRPSRGMQISASVEWATSALGGDTDFLKPHGEFTWFRPTFRNQHFGVHVEGGWVKPLNGDSIPVYERYFLGGETSLRAFESRGVRPRTVDGRFFIDPLTGLLEGGDRYGQFNFEYVWRVNDALDLIAFYDAGNTWHERQDLEFSDLRMDAGLEVRFFLPLFNAPLRLIYGFNLDPLDNEKQSQFLFSIGTTF